MRKAAIGSSPVKTAALCLSLALGGLTAIPNSVFAAEAAKSIAQESSADMVITGGKIYTNQDAVEVVEAVAIKDGRFVYVGTSAAAAAFAGEDTKVIDLQGQALYPGFVDAHAHLTGIGIREMTLNLETASSIKDMQDRVTQWRDKVSAELGAQTVLIGRGWIETHYPEKRFPSRWDLDQVITDIPVILYRADGHALVANSAAIKAAGITKDTKAPSGGAIHRNALGEATGIFVDTAMGLLAGLQPKMTDDMTRKALAKGGDVYAAYGWTGVHNMSVGWNELPIMENLSDSDELNIRVYNSINGAEIDQLFTHGPRTSDNYRIVTRAVKMYMDGALGSRGAALLAPYSDANTTGLVMMEEAATLPKIKQALIKGIQVNTHAIGDRGNRMVLDWYEKALADVPVMDRAIADPRWRIEHAQIINPEDIPRFKALSVIPSMQPSHAIGDLHFAPQRLGKDRLNGAYAWKSLIDSGVIVAGGSDAPVERGDPRIEFYAAVARRDMKGFSNEDWHAEEAVSRKNALKMFTLWPAYASFREKDLGSIEVGKLADMTGFDKDIMLVQPADILTANPTLTIVEGEIIFDRNAEEDGEADQ